MDHLVRLRELQDETHGFVTYITLAFHPDNTALQHIAKTTGFADIKNIAVARLMLDNIPHIKAYWVMMTPRIAQIALRFGADDLDGTIVEERIYHDAGATTMQGLRRAELLQLIRKAAVEGGAEAAVVCRHWAMGGEGAKELAEEVVKAAEKPSNFKFLYPLDWSIKKKIETIAGEVYGADGVDYSPEADARITEYTRLGFDKLPICIAKTHLSLSADPIMKGVPKGFRIPVRDIRASVGAGFIYPLLGKMSTMPGLPTRPAFYDVDIDLETGRVIGLF